jgi:CBS domain-containing protein
LRELGTRRIYDQHVGQAVESFMKLKDVMTENMAGVAPDTSLEQTARKMRDVDETDLVKHCFPQSAINVLGAACGHVIAI